jgi:hypothetical protein
MYDLDMHDVDDDGVPHEPTDWLGEEVDRIADAMALGFDQTEQLGLALADALQSLPDEDLAAGYGLIQAGIVAPGVSFIYVTGADGLLCEFADQPLLVISRDQLAQPSRSWRSS